MDDELKQRLTEFGLGHCIPMCWDELGFLSMTDVNETDLDDDFTELINDTFQKKMQIILFCLLKLIRPHERLVYVQIINLLL